MKKIIWLTLLLILAACGEQTTQPPVSLNVPTKTTIPQIELLPTDNSPAATPPLFPTATPLPPEPTITTVSPTSSPLPEIEATVTALPPLPTSTALPPLPTATPVLTVEPVETVPSEFATPTLLPDNGDDPTTITFAPGAIATRIEGRMLAGTRAYQLRALEGQQLFIYLSATNDTPNFSFTGLEDGMPYKRVVNEDRHYYMTLPATQDYELRVQSLAETYFWLDIVILPIGDQLPEAAHEIIPWLAEKYQQGVSKQTLEAILLATGQIDREDFVEPLDLDLTAHSSEDDKVWFVTVYELTNNNLDNVQQGDIGFISRKGLLYQPPYEALTDLSAPTFVYPLDLTGDGRIDPVLVNQNCGAHTCYQHYIVLTEDGVGGFRLISPFIPIEPDVSTIGNSNSAVSFGVEDGLGTLVVRGGTVNSAGGGPYQRQWTDTWRYDATVDQMVKISTVYDPSNYRFHLLHDADRAWDAGDLAVASADYLRVITDDTLDDGMSIFPIEESTADASKMYAAFRLMVYELLQGDETAALAWKNWLQDGTFDTVSRVADSAEIFWTTYTSTNNIAAACTDTTLFLQSIDNPTGAIGDLGYQLPSLNAESVCPVRE